MPASTAGGDGDGDPDAAADGMRSVVQGLVDGGLDPADVAATVVDGIRTRRFWIITHDTTVATAQRRWDAIAADGQPTLWNVIGRLTRSTGPAARCQGRSASVTIDRPNGTPRPRAAHRRSPDASVVITRSTSGLAAPTSSCSTVISRRTGVRRMTAAGGTRNELK